MDLEECLLITDATLTHLAMGCPRLEKLVSSAMLMLKFVATLAFIESFVISERRACHTVN